MKVLSILIPTYNVDKGVIKCLKSVLKQINNDCQVVIVDDFSTDETVPRIVEMINYLFEDEESFKFFINTKHRGEERAIEVAKKVATGKYIVTVPPNKRVTKHFVRQIFEKIEQGEEEFTINGRGKRKYYITKNIGGNYGNSGKKD